MGALNSGFIRNRLFAGTAFGAMLAMSATAHANASADVAAADAAADSEASESEAIVVTAQRRAQSTLDVGINVTSLSAERLAEERIVRIGELIQVTSNLEVREIRPGGGQPAITIRGVGMNDYTVASYPSTSVYFDGVYSPNIGTISQQFFDIQAVEVLKGPQSTLYGRNATAGAITFTSAQPTDELSGYASFTAGNYKSIDAEGAISGPIAEGLTGRLSVKTRQMYDGWMKNLHPGGHDIGEIHQVSLRAQLKWQPSDRLTVRAIFGYQNEDDEPGAFTAFGRRLPGGSPTVTTGFCPVSLAGQIDFNNTCASIFGSQRTSTDKRTISENDPWTVIGHTYTGTLIAAYKFDGFAVTSTTGYLKWQEEYTKSDGLPITEQTAVWDQNTWQVSQDLQVASTGKKTLDWMAGIYLSSANVDIPVYTIVPINGGNFISAHDADTRTIQGYAQFDFNVSPQLTLTAGARYLHEFNSKVGGTWKDVNMNRVIDAGDTNQAFLDDSMKQNALTWKLGVNFRPTPRTLIYGSVTHGYKSGGYIFAPIATNSSQLTAYKGEDIYAFEVGLKHSMWNDAVNLTASAFYYKYKDMQTNQQYAVGVLNINRFANLENAKVKGIDVELLLRPVRGLEVRLDGGWIDTWVDAFTSGGVNYAPGNRFANAPKFAGTASIRYETALTDNLEVAISGSVHRQGKVFANTENTPLYAIDSDATLANGQIQFTDTVSELKAAFWMKNITNEAYTNSTFQNGSAVNTLYNMPRTYGVTLSKSF